MTTAPALDMQKGQSFAFKVLGDITAQQMGTLSTIADRLGLFNALADAGAFGTINADTLWERLVALAHQRWVLEQFYEDAKDKRSLDHYQGRCWDGLHCQRSTAPCCSGSFKTGSSG